MKRFPNIETAKFPNLTHLMIQRIEMDQTGLSNIFKSGLKLKKLELRVTTIEICSLNDIHLIPTLEHVVIQFSSANLSLDFQSLSKLNLKKLELTRPQITTTSLTSLCSGDHQLKEMIFIGSSIAISDFAYFCNTLSIYLTRLDMLQCNLTGYHLKEIGKLVNLRYLNLTANNTLLTNDLLHLGPLC